MTSTELSFDFHSMYNQCSVSTVVRSTRGETGAMTATGGIVGIDRAVAIAATDKTVARVARVPVTAIAVIVETVARVARVPVTAIAVIVETVVRVAFQSLQ